MRASLSRFSFGFVCLVFAGGDAFAQTPHELVPVLTSQSNLLLSEKYGAPQAGFASNDAGDSAFIGANGTAVFYRKAGTPVAVRAIQFGDELPGLAGSRFLVVFSIVMNSSGLVVARADVVTVGRVTHVIFTFDGTTIQTLVTGRDAAPGTGGAKFERAMSLIGLNDNGDVLFGSTLLPVGSTATPLPTIFLKPFGSAVIRVAGPGDASPGTGGTFTGATAVALNNGGQILFHAAIAGGSGATGIFAWQSGVTRKVVAAGDPNPLGGAFADDFTTAQMRQNSANLIAFLAGNSLWHNTPGGGTAVAVAAGSATPAPMGGTYSIISGLHALAASGDTIVVASVTGGASSSAIFRFRSGSGTDVIARVNETNAAAPGKAFTSFTSFSVNAAGTVSCQITYSGGIIGIFQKPVGGALTAVVLQNAATPVGGTLFLLGAYGTTTTATGAVLVAGYTLGAPDAYFGVFLWSGTPATIMSTADLLPAGARTIVRNFFLTAAGNSVGMVVFKAGGGASIATVDTVFQDLEIVMTEGDVVPNTGGSVLDLQDLTTVHVASSGAVAMEGRLLGGAGGLFFRDAIIVAGGGVPPTAVVYDGILDTGGRTLRTAQIDIRPIAINSGATVAFTAVVNNGNRGLYTANPFGGPPQPVALVGDMTSTGQPITAITATHGGLDEAGLVLFTANTAAGQGLFIGAVGVTPIKVAQVGDAAPGGGTFSGFGTTPAQSFNSDQGVVFMATTTGGPGGGIYLSSDFNPPVAIALNGQAAPGGGTYVITTPRGDAVINEPGDIAFRADLTGGGSDSGIFLKRAGQAIELAASQGQAAPGTPSVFATMRPPPTGRIHESVALSDNADVAFFSQVNIPGSEQIAGWWHREVNGAIQRIAIYPGTHPEYDGATASSGASMTNWMFSNRIPMYVPLANGPHLGGLYIWVPVGGVTTNTGTNVQTAVEDEMTGAIAQVTFANVSGSGITRVSRASTGPALPRSWYRMTGINGYYTVTTTANVSGNITVCIDYSDHIIPNFAVLRLLHYENGTWVDVTSGGPVNNEICGTTTTLSPFVVAQAMNVTISNLVQNGNFSDGANHWSTFDGSMTFAVNGGVFEYSRPGGTAVVLQSMGVPAQAGTPLVAMWDMGNASSQFKRFSVLIHNDFGDFANADLHVCTFYLPPNAPMRTFAMRTHTTIAWSNITISFYAAAGATTAGDYRLDNVVFGEGSPLSEKRTDCVDPLAPAALGSTDGAPLIVNGTFSGGNGPITDGAHANSPWIAFGSSQGNLTAQVTNGVAQVIRPGAFFQPGALLQNTGIAVAAGQIVSATFQLGNSSGIRKRVSILLHDASFAHLAACTFWLPAGQPLSQYSMRTFVSVPWGSAMISFYPASNDNQWLLVDNVAMNLTPSAPSYGSDCEEPGDSSALGGAPPPGGGLADAAMAIRPELVRARFARVVQRLMSQGTNRGFQNQE